MNLGFNMLGLDKTSATIQSLPFLVNKNAVRRVKGGAAIVARFWQLALSGPARRDRLGVGTGKLKQSIGKGITDVSPGVARVGTALPYARIHEFGGTIRPKRGKYLTFKLRRAGKKAQWVSVRSVYIPARPHRAPAVRMARGPLATFFSGQVGLALKEAALAYKLGSFASKAEYKQLADLGFATRRTGPASSSSGGRRGFA